MNKQGFYMMSHVFKYNYTEIQIRLVSLKNTLVYMDSAT